MVKGIEAAAAATSRISYKILTMSLELVLNHTEIIIREQEEG